MTSPTSIRVAGRGADFRPLLRLAFLAALLVGVPAFGAALRFPEITAIVRESPADVRPGDTLTYRVTAVAGTSRIESVTLYFKGATRPTFRPLHAAAPVTGVISVTVPSTWVEDRYILAGATVRDEWSRTINYTEEGAVTGVNQHPGPYSHRLDFASLGFTLSGGYSGPVRAQLLSLAATSTGPFRPGESVRFQYTMSSGALPVESIAFSFGTFGSSHMVTVANPQASGEFSVPIVEEMTDGVYALTSFTTTDSEGRTAQYSRNVSNYRESLHGWAMTYFADPAPTIGNGFQVTGARIGLPATTRIGSLRRENPDDVAVGDTIRYSYTTVAPTFPVRSIQIRLTGPYGASRTYTNEASSGTFTIPVTADWITGPYTITQIIITDITGRAFLSGFTERVLNVRGLEVDPYFMLQPAAETYVRPGFPAELVAIGVGLGPVSYQWYRGEPSDTSQPVATESPSSGSLRVTITEPTTYWVRMTSVGQTADSRAARIVFASPPVITQQPVAQAAPIGSTVSFTVAARTTGEVVYTWFGGYLPSGTRRDRATLTFTVDNVQNAGLLSCRVSDAGGTVTSETVAFSVLETQPSLRFTKEPADVYASPNSPTIILDATVAGQPPITYRWQKNGVDIPDSAGTGGPNFSGGGDFYAFQPRLMLRSPQESDNGRYRLIVSNGYETLYSREAEFRIVTAPVIVEQPTALVSTTGNLVLRVRIVAAVSVSYQWRHNGAPIPNATSDTLVHHVANESGAGLYDVVVSAATGSVTSEPSRVSYRSPAQVVSIQSAPESRAARPGETLTFTLRHINGARFVWSKNGEVLQDSASDIFTLADIGPSDSGDYTLRVYGAYGGDVSRSFTVTVLPTSDTPVIRRQPTDAVVPRGSLARLSVSVDGREPLRFQWRRNGVPLPEGLNGVAFNRAEVVFPFFENAWVDTYDVVVTNTHGSATSRSARLSLPPPGAEGRLMNLSVRANAGGSHGPLIVGFVLGGGIAENVPLLVRASGPALTAFGVAGAMGNPLATLYRGTAPTLANDDWSGAPFTAATAARVGAFPFPTTQVNDAALTPSLAPGAYTVHVTGAAYTSGVALAEIYDATPAAEINSTRPRLLNLSVQTRVTPDSPVIAGFVLGGAQPRRVLVRAIGPSLAGFGVQGVLADPQLVLRKSDSLVASNDDWAGDTSVRDAAAASGAFALSSTASKDAALVATLVPGSYTAQVTGAAGASGLVLVEVYKVP